MTIESKYQTNTTLTVRPELVKLYKKFGGRMGESCFGGPTLYFDRSEEQTINKVRKYVGKHFPELKYEWRANYNTFAIY